jgi:hypothetical protein
MKKVMLILVFVMVLVSCATTPNGDLLNNRIVEIEQEVIVAMDKVDPATIPQGMRYDIDRNIILYRIIREAKPCGYKPGYELDRFLESSWAYVHLNDAIDAKMNLPALKGGSLSDILCKWRRIIRTEPVLFRTQWRTGLTPAPNPLPA